MGLRDTMIIRLFDRTNSRKDLVSLLNTILSPKIDQKAIDKFSSCFQRFKLALRSKYRIISSSRLCGFSSQIRISSKIVSTRSWSSIIVYNPHKLPDGTPLNDGKQPIVSVSYLKFIHPNIYSNP